MQINFIKIFNAGITDDDFLLMLKIRQADSFILEIIDDYEDIVKSLVDKGLVYCDFDDPYATSRLTKKGQSLMIDVMSPHKDEKFYNMVKAIYKWSEDKKIKVGSGQQGFVDRLEWLCSETGFSYKAIYGSILKFFTNNTRTGLTLYEAIGNKKKSILLEYTLGEMGVRASLLDDFKEDDTLLYLKNLSALNVPKNSSFYMSGNEDKDLEIVQKAKNELFKSIKN